jgi:hypothetical protein
MKRLPKTGALSPIEVGHKKGIEFRQIDAANENHVNAGEKRNDRIAIQTARKDFSKCDAVLRV